MIYIRAYETFMYHRDYVTKKGNTYTKNYLIYRDQLLTTCEAIQKFKLTIDDIICEYPLEFVRVNRRHTAHLYKGHIFEGRYVKDGYLETVVLVQ